MQRGILETLYVRGGEYTNTNYGTGSLDNNAVSLNINNSLGSLYNPLIIRNYLNEVPKLKLCLEVLLKVLLKYGF